MNRRYKNKPLLPRVWLMTDPRLDGQLLHAVQRLPVRSGVIFRHYHLDEDTRHKLFLAVRRICRRRGHRLLLAGSERRAIHWHADGYHDHNSTRQKSRRLIHSAPVHNHHEIQKAKHAGADMVLLSPLFATASHINARPLGRTYFMQLAKLCSDKTVIALGGMNARKGLTVNVKHIDGWAAIGAFMI
jgi:thiamine-phosphate pyrophosphorylase